VALIGWRTSPRPSALIPDSLNLNLNMKNSTTVWTAAAALLLFAVPAPAQDSGNDFQFGGEMRFRTTNSDASINHTGRLRFNMAKELDQVVSTFVEIQTNGTIGTELGDLTLHQAYMRLNGFGGDLFDVKAGRFEMNYGQGRMVSSYDWNDGGSAWDGLLFQHATEDHTLDVIYTKAVSGQPTGFGTVDASTLAGLYYQRNIAGWDSDFYALSREMDAGGSDLTLGALVEGSLQGFELSGELASQSGEDAANDDKSGSVIILDGTYDLGGEIKLGARYTMADDFDPINDNAHFNNGHMDLVSLNDNLTDIAIYGLMPIDDNWSWYGVFHSFTGEEDGLFGDAIGNEIDLGIWGNVGEHTGFWAGYSTFMDGERTGDDLADDSWFFAQVVLDF
jgi:hypothetical protein